MNLPRLLTLGLLLALTTGSVVVFPSLPGLIPTHFDASGTADAWSERSLISWFGAPVFAVGLTLFLWILQLLIPRYPALVNIPDKEKFLAMTRRQREPVVAAIRRVLDWVSAFTVLVFVFVQLGVYRTAMGGEGGLLVISGLLISPVLLLVVALELGRVQRLILEAGRRVEMG